MNCFYHSADLDGHCSGAIVKRVHPECELIEINYGDVFPWESILPGEDVYMVDFSLQPFSDMERLNGMCRLTWIDHHKTAIEEAESRDFKASGGQFLGKARAACELTWYYFNRTSIIPDSVHHLGRYDVWDHKDLHTLHFQYGMRNFDNTRPEGNESFWLDIFSDVNFDVIIAGGRILYKYEKLQNQKICAAYAFETQLINGMKGICLNRGFCSSQIFESVYDPAKHELMITFCRLKPPAGKWKVSLYSTREDVDCGDVAKQFGGGGHKGAAGFQCEYLPFGI